MLAGTQFSCVAPVGKNVRKNRTREITILMMGKPSPAEPRVPPHVQLSRHSRGKKLSQFREREATGGGDETESPLVSLLGQVSQSGALWFVYFGFESQEPDSRWSFLWFVLFDFEFLHPDSCLSLNTNAL